MITKWKQGQKNKMTEGKKGKRKNGKWQNNKWLNDTLQIVIMKNDNEQNDK